MHINTSQHKSPSFVSIHNLSVRFEKTQVLDQFSAEYGQGLHWIQGHNGSGKSTLLKTLCGINEFSEGCIKIKGCDLQKTPQAAKAKICYVPDKPEVYPFMTGGQYLNFIANIKNTLVDVELLGWLELIKLTPFMDFEFAKMSFGTRRKFILSSVLIGSPAVILLDEPFNGLDQNSAAMFRDWLVKMKSNLAILIVNHEAQFIEDIVDSKTKLNLF